MKDPKIVQGYDRAAPPLEAAGRIYEAVLREAPAQRERPVKRGHPLLRRALLAAACVAMLASLLTAGYAAYQKWKLPKPTGYTPDPENGNVAVHGESRYTVPTDVTDAREAEPLSDQFFLLRAREILAQAGVAPKDDSSATVRRQTHLYWNREEAEVRWANGGSPITVTFDAEKGVFIGMSGIEWVLTDSAACHTQQEADALAERYYRSLPVEQGYVMQSCEKYDEQYWAYDFCREVEPGLYSWYECVRISINPVSGDLEGCRVFYVPLLDDHQEGDRPLTEAQALDVVRARGFDPDHCKELRIRKVVETPNWIFSDQNTEGIIHAQSSDVSRLCWQVEIDNSDEFANVIFILVDYYTGEILGGDMTQ